MAFKVVIVCTFALFQTIACQCIGNFNNPAFGLAANGLAGFSGLSANSLAANALAGNGLAANALAGNGLGLASAYSAGCGGVASTGGGLPVTSGSPIAPTGVSVVSENAYEGPLAVGGNLPFLGTVAVEGNLPTAGAGAVSYGCGDGAVGIATEGPIATGIVGPATYPAGPVPAAAGLAGYNGINGYANGLGRFGIGAGNCAI